MRLRSFEFDGDMQAVRELWSRSGPGVQISVSDSDEEIRKKLDRDPELFIVAEGEDRVVGAVLAGFDGRRGMVYHLAVDRDHRRKGIGRALMGEIEQRLRSKGCLKYYLMVREDNPQALAFYAENGNELMSINILGKVLR